MDKVSYYYPEQAKELAAYINGHVKVLANQFDKTFLVTIQEKKPPKTWQQCKGWHRILNVIAQYLNEHNFENKIWSTEHVKFIVKHAIQFGEFRLDAFIPRSFASATKEEAIDVITKTQQFAVDELSMNFEDVQLTSDEQQAFNAYYDSYK